MNQAEGGERIIEIALERLRFFTDHPFQVKNDLDMEELRQSIKKLGILTPLLVRPNMEGCYEIISGHRRYMAAKSLGYEKLPAVIRVLSNDDAIITMVDTNLRRERILPSEKAMAYRMKYDAIKRKSGRKKRGQIDPQMLGKRSVEVLSETTQDSAKQIQRYLKLTDLIPELLNKLDTGELSLNPAVALSYLPKTEQEELVQALEYTQSLPSLSQAQRMKKLSMDTGITFDQMVEILSEIKQSPMQRVCFKNDQLYRFFPRTYSAEKMQTEIVKILTLWAENNLSVYAQGVYFMDFRTNNMWGHTWYDTLDKVNRDGNNISFAYIVFAQHIQLEIASQ